MNTPSPAHSRSIIFAAACAGMFCYGIVLALLGALFGLPAFRERVGMSFQQQGVILGIVYLGVWLTTPMVGPVIDRFGNKLVLLSATMLVTASLFGFVLVQSFVQALAAALILGFGGGGLNTSTNALVSDIFGAERGPYLNYLGIFYGLGALFTPLLASTISQRFTELILFVASFCAACSLAFALLRFPPAREAHSFAIKDATRVAAYPGVLLFAVLLFFESGNEAVITGFASRYAESLGASTRVAAWALTAYLGALMFGRVLAGQVLRRISKAQLVLSCAAASLGAYALFVLAGSVGLTILCAGLVGFCFSAIFPTTLAIIGDRYQRFSASVFSFIFTVALIGGMVFPPLVGRLAASYGLRGGMAVPLAGIAIVLALAISLRARHQGRAEDSQNLHRIPQPSDSR